MAMQKINVRFRDSVIERCDMIARINMLERDVISNVSMVARSAIDYGLDMLEEWAVDDAKKNGATQAEIDEILKK